MQYLNIEIKILSSHEFLGSNPIDRATWLCLLKYCVQQETGGIISNCKNWDDRKWMQLIGITKKESKRVSLLWEWDGSDLKVWEYPVHQETKMKANRENGKKGGKLKAITQKEPHGSDSVNPSGTQEEPHGSDLVNPSDNPSGTQKEPHGSNSVNPSDNPSGKVIGIGIGKGIGIEKTPPKAPQGESSCVFESLKKGISKIYNRKESTVWSDKENKKLKEVARRPDAETEFLTIEELYESGNYEYFRRDIITLLNNWPGEVDRARIKGYGEGQAGKKIMNEKKVFDPRDPETWEK